MNKFKKIAFIKFGGLSSGGTEVSFQNVAKSLSEKFSVDYYYCDSAPYIGSNWVHPDTDKDRQIFLEISKVNLIKFEVGFKDVTTKTHDWVETNFWEKFNEDDYSLLFITSAGHPEYPFHKIKKIPIVNIVTVNGGVNNQENIIKTILISKNSAETWINQGGNQNKISIIPLCREPIMRSNENYRSELKINDKFVFGFHQRSDDSIFSEVPLKAFKRIENEKNMFFLLGGSKLYEEQSKDLSIKNFIKLQPTADVKVLDKFLNTLDVFTHGRKYGETMGLVLTEAMSYNLPLISHRAESNAQEEVIGPAGKVFNRKNVFSYSREMLKLQNNYKYYQTISKNSNLRFKNNYSHEIIIKKYLEIVEDII